MKNYLWVCLIFALLTTPADAWLGIHIGLPSHHPGSGSVALPLNAVTFNGKTVLFNGNIVTFTHS